MNMHHGDVAELWTNSHRAVWIAGEDREKVMKEAEVASQSIQVSIADIPRDCWPQPGCTNGRDWAVFHDRAEADKPFNPWTSVYVGTCSYHILKALRHDPMAENIVKPYPNAERGRR